MFAFDIGPRRAGDTSATGNSSYGTAVVFLPQPSWGCLSNLRACVSYRWPCFYPSRAGDASATSAIALAIALLSVAGFYPSRAGDASATKPNDTSASKCVSIPAELGMPQQLREWLAARAEVSIPAELGMPQQQWHTFVPSCWRFLSQPSWGCLSNTKRGKPVSPRRNGFYPSRAGDASATYPLRSI